MLLLQKKKKILPKPYIFSPLSHIKFSSCLEKHFFFWNCFSPGFTHEKKVFFPENKQKNSKKKKHSHDIFFHSLSLMKKKSSELLFFHWWKKKMKSIQNFFFYQFLSRQHRRENYLENRSLGKKEASVLIIWKS